MTFTFGDMKKLIKKLIKIPEISGIKFLKYQEKIFF